MNVRLVEYDKLKDASNAQLARLRRLMADAEDDTDSCHDFGWPLNAAGYGIVELPGRDTYYAHRVAMCLHHKRDIEPTEICRHFVCGNPQCVNPYHLRVGTFRDNANDTVRDGNCSFAKLTPEQVVEMRQRYPVYTVENSRRAAEEYGVTRATAYNVLKRKTWVAVKIV